jgi:hypothetical protein
LQKPTRASVAEANTAVDEEAKVSNREDEEAQEALSTEPLTKEEEENKSNVAVVPVAVGRREKEKPEDESPQESNGSEEQ